jgi:hypothetical protein
MYVRTERNSYGSAIVFNANLSIFLSTDLSGPNYNLDSTEFGVRGQVMEN